MDSQNSQESYSEMPPLTNSQEDRLLESVEDIVLQEEKHVFTDLDNFVEKILENTVYKANVQEEYILIKQNIREYFEKRNTSTPEASSSPRKQVCQAKDIKPLKDYLIKDTRVFHLELFSGLQDIKTVSAGIQNIHHVLENINRASSHKLRYYAIIGSILKAIKQWKPRNLQDTLKQNKIYFSPSYVCFLVKFYTFCEDYPKVQQLSLCIKYIKNNFKRIQEEVKEDANFWKNLFVFYFYHFEICIVFLPLLYFVSFQICHRVRTRMSDFPYVTG